MFKKNNNVLPFFSITSHTRTFQKVSIYILLVVLLCLFLIHLVFLYNKIMNHLLYTIFLIITGAMNWPFYLLLSSFIYSFSILLSTWSVLFEEITFHKYRRKRDVMKLILISFVEPFLYVMLAYFSVKGNIQHLMKKDGWGKMERQGTSN